MKKKVVSMVLSLVMTAGLSSGVLAETEEEMMEYIAWDNMQLEATYNSINDLYGQKQQLENEIAILGDNLVSLMVSTDILQGEIEAKKGDIATTSANLEKAQNAVTELTDTIKERLQYLYENGGDDAWLQMLLNAENLADLLTKAEYSQAIYEQDVKNLQKLEATASQVEELQNKYEVELSELTEMEQAYQDQMSALQVEIQDREYYSESIDEEIAYAYQLAADYEAIIAQEQEQLEQLIADRIAVEEAQRQAALEAAAEPQVGGNGQEVFYVDEGGTIFDSNGEVVGVAPTTTEVEYDENGEAVATREVSTVSSGYYSGSSSSGSGSAVVDFASQFLGNAYVYGGTSLTDGTDCSGFTQSVYANFGVDLPRTSYEQQNAGYEVPYSEAQPGDLICYGGHVAIYMGDGRIIHASNEAEGIKISEDATYRQILSVRRLV